MNKKFLPLLALLAVPFVMGAEGGCSDTKTVSAAEQQSRRIAAEVDASTTENNEANSIGFKRTVMGRPGLMGYVVFLSADGRPIQYLAVKGKCTSGSKRLTQQRRYEFVWGYGKDAAGTGLSNSGSWDSVDGPGEDGTYGSSDAYIYCQTTSGAYVQWNGTYLYSDKPFDLTIKPLVISLAGTEQGQ